MINRIIMKKTSSVNQVRLDDIFRPIREYREKIHRLYLESISSAEND